MYKIDTMNKISLTAIITLIAFLPCISIAQSVQVNYDKKVIMTDSLNLPPNLGMSSVLSILPELLQRPGNFIMSNYDVQIMGMSVGDAADVAINQLQIVDVEKIEVSESPISSYTNNGQGGSINFVLRSSTDNDKHFWGSAGTSVSYQTNLAPQFNIGYSNSKLLIRGMILGEINNTTSDVEDLTFKKDKFISSSKTSTDNQFRTQLARAYLQYTPSSKDIININVSEIYSSDKEKVEYDYAAISSSETEKKSTNLQAMVNYQHKFGKSTLTTELQYIYIPGKNHYYESGMCSNDNDYHSNQLAGKIEFNASLLDKPATHNHKQKKASITMGVNLNRVNKTEDIILDDLRYGSSIVQIDPDNKTFYAMPYVRFESTLGRFRLKMVGEFQHFKYDIRRKDLPFSKKSNDFTGKFMGEWHFTPQQNLRLILDRKLQRPNDEQLYPYRMYNPNRMVYEEGNTELDPTMSHEVALDYIINKKYNNEQAMTINVGANFNHVSNIIISKFTQAQATQCIGLSQKYLIFANDGNSNILGANLMALYTYHAFTISFTGNVYHKHQHSDNTSNYSTYYNLSLYPHFNLKDGWHGGARLIYYSKEEQKNATLGSSAVAFMTVGKAWNKLFVYAYEKISMQKHSIDRTYEGIDTALEKHYDMVPNCVGIGMKYTF